MPSDRIVSETAKLMFQEAVMQLDNYLLKINYVIGHENELAEYIKNFKVVKYAKLLYRHDKFILIMDKHRNCELTAKRVKNILQTKAQIRKLMKKPVSNENYPQILFELDPILRKALDVNRQLSMEYHCNKSFRSNLMQGYGLLQSFFGISFAASRASEALKKALNDFHESFRQYVSGGSPVPS